MWSVQAASIRISETPEASSAPGTDRGIISTGPPFTPSSEKIVCNPRIRKGSVATRPSFSGSRDFLSGFSGFSVIALRSLLTQHLAFSRPTLALVEIAARTVLELRQHDSLLILVLALTVRVTGLAHLVGLKEQYLAQPFIGVDLGRQGRRVRDLECHKALPLGFKRRHVDNDAASRISRLADTNCQHIAGNLEVFDRPRQRKRVRRHNDAVGHNRHKRPLIKGFRVDNGAVDVGKDLELVRNPQVVPVGGEPIGDNALPDLFFAER